MSTAIPTPNPGSPPYAYYGCVAEPSKGRLLSHLAAGGRKDMTVSLCFSLCKTAEAKIPGISRFAGVQYGQECWCGSTINWIGDAKYGSPGVTPGRNATAVECKMRCTGAPNELCGGSLRMNLYYQ